MLTQNNPLDLQFEYRLLQSDGCADFFQLGLDLVCFCLGGAFLQSLGSVVYQVLGFLQAQAGDLSDDLDDLDLFRTDCFEYDVEFVLLFFSG